MNRRGAIFYPGFVERWHQSFTICLNSTPIVPNALGLRLTGAEVGH